MENKLKIISLGGFGNVTSNMFVYELEDEITGMLERLLKKR